MGDSVKLTEAERTPEVRFEVYNDGRCMFSVAGLGFDDGLAVLRFTAELILESRRALARATGETG